MLAASVIVLHLVVVVLQISVHDQVHRCLDNLGHRRGNRKQQNDRDEKPHVPAGLLRDLHDVKLSLSLRPCSLNLSE